MNASRTVRLATFALVVFDAAKTASPNPIYSFTTFNVPGLLALAPAPSGLTTVGRIAGRLEAEP